MHGCHGLAFASVKGCLYHCESPLGTGQMRQLEATEQPVVSTSCTSCTTMGSHHQRGWTHRHPRVSYTAAMAACEDWRRALELSRELRLQQMSPTAPGRNFITMLVIRSWFYWEILILIMSLLDVQLPTAVLTDSKNC